MSESKIVEAVGVSANVGVSGSSGNYVGKRLAQMIEAAMSQAVLDANAEGITDPKIIKARMMAARKRVKDELAKPKG